MIKCRLAALTPIVIAALLAGCGGDPSPAQPSGSATATGADTSGPAMITSTPVKLDLAKVNVCGLLTRAEIEEAVGPGDWNPQTREGVKKACDFNPRATLIVGLPDEWEKEIVVSNGTTPITGVGDEAFVTERTLVALLRERGIVKLSLFDLDNPYDPEEAKQLALKAIRRLP